MANTKEKEKIKQHLDLLANDYDKWKKKNQYFYKKIENFLKRTVIPGSSVMELGCRTGDMLACVKPSRGVGLDISSEIIKRAKEKYPEYDFFCDSAETFRSDEKFDYIILINVLGYVKDITCHLDSLYKFCHPKTRIILTTINPWWDFFLTFMEKLNVKMPSAPHNFIEKGSLTKILDSLDFSISYSGYMLLCPKYIPGISFMLNTIGTRLFGVKLFSFVQYMILRPVFGSDVDLGYGASVVIPCYNEEENIEQAVSRVPDMGKGTEIIVVNDGSSDNTAGIVRNMQKTKKNLRLIDYSPNKGKGFAVRSGFDAAKNEIIMILDADMTVTPEELPRFFKLLNRGVCDFVNGTRLIYPMQNKAMKKANLIGNKLFSALMTFLTGQHLTDTLCGTKVLYKKDYKRMKMGVDKWGDFDLLFGAAKNGDKILEVPVHYMSRQAGKSKMKALSHGVHLVKVCARGFKELVLGL